jgi:tetratricopeptide (TPR) repeat protein
VSGVERRSAIHRNWTVALLVIGAVVLLLGLDRRSLERANHQYRAGYVASAADLYGRLGPGSNGRIAYNLGTATIALGDADPDSLLVLAATDPDSATRQRAYYNLGYVRLTQVGPALDPDTASILLDEAVEYGRAALRLDPRHASARWNLALAQRMLDSLSLLRVDPDRRERAGNDETPIELVALTRSGEGTGESGLEPENPEAGESSGERRGASEGAREAWATQDPGPMTAGAALVMVQTVRDDPEQLLRGILWSHRPDVAWWNAEPYPGGDW